MAPSIGGITSLLVDAPVALVSQIRPSPSVRVVPGPRCWRAFASTPAGCAGLDFVGAPVDTAFDPKTSPFGRGPASPILSRFLEGGAQDPWRGMS